MLLVDLIRTAIQETTLMNIRLANILVFVEMGSLMLEKLVTMGQAMGCLHFVMPLVTVELHSVEMKLLIQEKSATME